ncbi:MAG: AhpC/TSA family [Chthonomonadales bacterium]|nr:AhpC/TSA family [Chthonomonadales bacterium]
MPTRSVTIASLLILLSLALPTRQSPAQTAPTYKIGSKIADFAFKNDLGKTVKLSDYRGKTVVLVMFANW